MSCFGVNKDEITTFFLSFFFFFLFLFLFLFFSFHLVLFKHGF